MGHWDATTLGNDGAWDCIAALVCEHQTTEIVEFLKSAFGPPERGDLFDEGEAPYVVAAAEVVAAALGRPSENGLPESVAPWLTLNGELATAFRDDALASVAIAARSPYAKLWSRPEGADEFEVSCADLTRRLAAGRVLPIRDPPARFLAHLARCCAGDGWTADLVMKALVRPIDGGCQRVRPVFVGKEGRWRAALWFEVAFFAPQRIIYEVLGKEGDPDQDCVLAVAQRERSDRKGPAFYAHMDAASAVVPEEGQLAHGQLRAEDVLHPERTVRRAAERAAELVLTRGREYFAARSELSQFLPWLEGPDFDALFAAGKAGSLNHWVPIAWSLDRALGERMLAARRAKLGGFDPGEAAPGLATLDRIEQRLRAGGV